MVAARWAYSTSRNGRSRVRTQWNMKCMPVVWSEDGDRVNVAAIEHLPEITVDRAIGHVLLPLNQLAGQPRPFVLHVANGEHIRMSPVGESRHHLHPSRAAADDSDGDPLACRSLPVGSDRRGRHDRRHNDARPDSEFSEWLTSDFNTSSIVSTFLKESDDESSHSKDLTAR